MQPVPSYLIKPDGRLELNDFNPQRKQRHQCEILLMLMLIPLDTEPHEPAGSTTIRHNDAVSVGMAATKAYLSIATTEDPTGDPDDCQDGRSHNIDALWR